MVDRPRGGADYFQSLHREVRRRARRRRVLRDAVYLLLALGLLGAFVGVLAR